MGSKVTRDDIENAVWKAGIRDAHTVDTILRLVDVYALGVRRQAENGTAKIVEPFGHLSPGESDLAMGVTRCRFCLVPKRFEQFYADKDSDSGHRDVCRRCTGPGRGGKNPDLALELTCAVCGAVKLAEGNFVHRIDTDTGYARKCKDCSAGIRECPSCGKRRRSSSFRRPDLCVWCDPGV